MDKDEALRLALEALEYEAQKGNDNAYQFEREAIKAALEAKDEPVGLIESLKDAKPCCGQYETCWRACTPRGKFIGHRDAQRTWVGLTDEEIVLIVAECAASHQHTDIHFARAIEAKLKEKNT